MAKHNAIVATDDTEQHFLMLASDDRAQQAKAMLAKNTGSSGITLGDLDRIKVPTAGITSWSVPTAEGEVQAPAIIGVIVAFRDVRAYYRNPYSGENNPPDCTSQDMEHGHGDIGDGQQSRPCASCPMSQWGSKMGPDGKARKGQACAVRRPMLILEPEGLLPKILSVPPSSLKSLRSYFLRLSAPYDNVVTSLALEKVDAKPAYSRIVPRMMRLLSPAEVTSVKAYQQAALGAFEAVTIDADEVVEGE